MMIPQEAIFPENPLAGIKIRRERRFRIEPPPIG
jgi:hypothetical protein